MQIEEIHARAWLNVMRREWVKRNGVEQGRGPVPTFDELPVADQQILIRASRTTLAAIEPANVQKIRQRQAS